MIIPALQVKSIAIFRALQLGDLLCAVPAFRAIREAYPAAQITLITLPGSKSIFDRFSAYFDHFLAFPGYHGLPEQDFTLAELEAFQSYVQQKKFDLAIQMQGNGSIVNDMMSNWSAKYVAGFCPHPSQETPLFLTYPNTGHESFRHLALIKHLGIPVRDPEMSFPISDLDYAYFNKLEMNLEVGKYICIHAGSRGSWRQWPTKYFAALGSYCQEKGFQMVLTGTAEELPIVNEVVSLMDKPPLIAAGRTSLGQLAVLLDKCHLLISNCTGVSHIAAGIKKQSIVISMDGEPERWAPVNRTLHRTIDWTRTPDYELVFKEMLALLDDNKDLTASTTSSGVGGTCISE
jgi:ADP-heptose:LPS heptosyltransferase